MVNPPIFIVGVGRSGTTLIRQIINNHPVIAIPYESHFITKYNQNATKYSPLTNSDNIDHLLEDILNEKILRHWDYVPSKRIIKEKLVEPSISGVFDTFFTEYALHHGKARWGDKSDYLNRMYEINHLFPNAQFIHIVRDGRDVANSVMKLDWGPNNIIDAAHWWNDNVILGHSMGKMLPNSRYLTVRYEDLVIDTETQLDIICNFLNVKFEKSMLEYYTKAQTTIPDDLLNLHINSKEPPLASRCFAWKNEMKSIDVAIFQQLAQISLLQFNYEIIDIPQSNLMLNMRKSSIMLNKIIKKLGSNKNEA